MSYRNPQYWVRELHGFLCLDRPVERRCAPTHIDFAKGNQLSAQKPQQMGVSAHLGQKPLALAMQGAFTGKSVPPLNVWRCQTVSVRFFFFFFAPRDKARDQEPKFATPLPSRRRMPRRSSSGCKSLLSLVAHRGLAAALTTQASKAACRRARLQFRFVLDRTLKGFVHPLAVSFSF